LRVILKSGHVIEDVEITDNTKSAIGLWVWSTKQNTDQLLTFKGITIRSSEIAAIEDHNNEDIPMYDIDNNMPENMKKGRF
jgi:hypothetical protein